jgi:glyoxylase-like metal-dependent hydrolase (beta-lactamase superfamily II)
MDAPLAGTHQVRQEKLPASEEVTEVAPGVLRLQLTISFPGLGHVNCYAIEDSFGVTLVDPGLPGIAPWRQLERRMEQAGLSLKRVHTVVVTHSHPDHFGAAERIRKLSGAELVTEQSFKTFFDPDEEDDEQKELADPVDIDAWAAARERLVRFWRSATLANKGPASRWNRPTPWGGSHPRPDRKTRWRYRTEGLVLSRYFRPPLPSRRVVDGQVMTIGGREWLAVHTPGHTVDHLCLLDPANGVLISGDHVLPTITPHISGLVRAADPLDLFLASLDKVRGLNGITTVLPAHGHPFDDLPGRVETIKEHHDDRLNLLRQAAGDVGEATVEAHSQRLFKPTSWGPMADSETYAHLEHLRHQGQARRRKVGDQLLYQVEPDSTATTRAVATTAG